MKFLAISLFLGGVAFVGYALYTNYQATPRDQNVRRRVWTSLCAAAATIAAAVSSWFHSGASP